MLPTKNWDFECKKWLKERGYKIVTLLDVDPNDNKVYIACGKSNLYKTYKQKLTIVKKELTFGHAVLWQNGKMIWDPNPADVGIENINNFYYVGLLSDPIEEIAALENLNCL